MIVTQHTFQFLSVLLAEGDAMSDDLDEIENSVRWYCVCLSVQMVRTASVNAR